MSPVSSTRKPAHTRGGTNPALGMGEMGKGGQKGKRKQEKWGEKKENSRVEKEEESCPTWLIVCLKWWVEDIPWIFLRVWSDPASPREAQRGPPRAMWGFNTPQLPFWGLQHPPGIPEMRRLSWKPAWSSLETPQERRRARSGVCPEPPAWPEKFGHKEWPWVVKFEFRFGQECPGKESSEEQSRGKWVMGYF